MSTVEFVVVIVCVIAGFWAVSLAFDAVAARRRSQSEKSLNKPISNSIARDDDTTRSTLDPSSPQPETQKQEPRIQATARRRRNYFARHWRGELSLPISYWVNGFLGTIVAAAVIAMITRTTNFKGDFKPELALLSVMLTWSVLLLIELWQFVGVWRSATKYKLLHPERYWGGIAKFFILLGLLRVIGDFLGHGMPQL